MSFTVEITAGNTFRAVVATDASVTLTVEQIHILCALSFALRESNIKIPDINSSLETVQYTASGNSISHRDGDESNRLVWDSSTTITHDFECAAGTCMATYTVTRDADYVTLKCQSNHQNANVTLTLKNGMLESIGDSSAVTIYMNSNCFTRKWFSHNKCYRVADPENAANIVTRDWETCYMHYNANGHLHRDLADGPAVYMMEEREGVIVKCNPCYYTDGELYTIMPLKAANRMIDAFHQLSSIVVAPSLPVVAPSLPAAAPSLPVATHQALLLPSIPAGTDLPAPIIHDFTPSIPGM